MGIEIRSQRLSLLRTIGGEEMQVGALRTVEGNEFGGQEKYAVIVFTLLLMYYQHPVNINSFSVML